MERYFTNVSNVSFTDRLIEATMKDMIAQSPKVLANPDDYDAWSELMWAGNQSPTTTCSIPPHRRLASHDIEHEVSGIYDVAHGAGLAVVFPPG